MLHDVQGLPVTTARPETVAAIDALMARQANLYYDLPYRDAVVKAADADPAVLPNVIAGIIHIHKGLREGAARYLARAKASLADATERERWFFEAVDAWRVGDVDASIRRLEEIAAKYPHDLYSARLCCMHKFYTRKDPDGALRLVRNVLAAAPETSQGLGLLSFMEEEAKLYGAAEINGRKAVALDRASVMGQHTVVHVMEAQGRDREGVDWMNQFVDTWEELNESFHPHMWMHLGIFHVGLGQWDRALEIFDRGIMGSKYRAMAPAQLYGINLLARAELDGMDVGSRWRDLRHLIERPAYVHTNPLTDLHFVYALARGGGDGRRYVAGMERHAAGLHAAMQATWQEVMLPTARAILAFVAGDFELAWRELAGAHARFDVIGGSAVERAVFDELWLHSMLRTRRFKEAAAVLQARIAQKGPKPRFQVLLSAARAAT